MSTTDPGGSGPETRPSLRERDEAEPGIGHPAAPDRSLGTYAAGVTRWRKKPVDVDMIRWDGSDEALRLIRQHNGQPERCADGSINIWVEASDAEMNLDLGDWAVLELDGSGVYPCRDSDHARVYEPAGSPDPAGDHEALRKRISEALQDSIDRCARCQTCDAQVDAVLAVVAPLAPAGDAPLPATAKVLRAQVAAVIQHWEDEDGMSDPADAVMAVLEPVLGHIRECWRGDQVTVTRDELADALTRLDMSVPVTGPAAGMINAGSMAGAIMEALAAAEVTG